MAIIELPHADLVTGALSNVLQWVSQPVQNTLRDIDTYVGRPMGELFPAPHGVPVVQVQERWRLPGLVSEELACASLHVPLEPRFQRRYREQYGATHTVHARRVRPARAGKRPRLLYLHGYMQPETYVEELALLSSMALVLDAEIIQMQFPYHGRRTPRGSRFSGELFWTADLVRSFEALRQTVLDARTLLSYLLDEDERPVGVAGLSLGGALTLSLTCLEKRFAFSVPIIAHMDLAAMVAEAPVLATMRRDLRRFGWDMQDFAAFVRSVGWGALRPKLPAERILLLAASHDRFFAPDVVTAMWRRWHEPEIHWYPTSHMGFLPRLPAALRQMRAFIDGLDTPRTRESRRTSR